MVMSFVVLAFACGSSGCVLWLCVVVVWCGCVLWLCVVAVCLCLYVCECVCGCVLVAVRL